MIEMPKYKNPVSLIPGGCPQLLDYEAGPEILEKIKYGFAEKPDAGDREKNLVRLHAYGRNENGEYVDEIDPSRPGDQYDYEIRGEKGIEPWLDQWIPVPFLRIRDQTWPDSSEPRFEYGPSNWARARLIRKPNGNLRLVLAFDMQVEEKGPPTPGAKEDVQPALTRNDVASHAQFRLAWRFRDNSWFMNLVWVEEWLREVWEAWRRKNNRKPREDDPRLEHLARYLVYLAVLQQVSNACETSVVRPDGGCVDVDLILDIGNSRTTGILVETQTQSATSLNNSYLLQLRDMDEPDKVYVEPFETRVEFSEIQFGNDALSLRSGRRTPAFVWPSPVRMGPEAARLATLSRCEKGSTGMSSPKRYLWDERNWKRTWRFNTKSENAPYVTRGPLVQEINSSGTPLCCMDDPLFKRNRILKVQERESAFESIFTRSSLMMFLFVEIIQQALLTINSPGQRIRREPSAVPRRLRQIIFTVPSGMPMAEQKIYRRWAKWAVHVLWEALGWGQYYIDYDKQNVGHLSREDYRTSPRVRGDWDEATCTQLVFVYNEVIYKYQGDASLFFEMMGRERDFGEKKAPSVRLATIDIGGGTTDLSITTFELANAKSSTPRVVAHPNFHDGFNLAGDDILRTVVAEHVLPAIGDALGNAGITQVQAALNSLFSRANMDATVAEINRRIQFVRQIAVPVALRLLDLYQKADIEAGEGRVAFTFGHCFNSGENGGDGGKKSAELGNWQSFPMPGEAARAWLEEFVTTNTGLESFSVMDIPIVMDPVAMEETVRGVLKEIFANLCEVINLYDCDALLLTGKPSTWPGIVNIVSSLLPVPPGRIFPMADYSVTGWYPFKDLNGKISDPKTTVVVGAIICALAEGQLEGFSFDSRELGLLSTARYIGEMELNGQLKKNKIWFTADPETGAVEPARRDIDFNGPISVGFRQLEAERWTTTRYYILDYRNNQDSVLSSLNMPLKVTLQMSLENEDDDSERDEGEIEIVNVAEADGEDSRTGKLLEMRLQTLPRDEGFWLDTGIVYED